MIADTQSRYCPRSARGTVILISRWPPAISCTYLAMLIALRVLFAVILLLIFAHYSFTLRDAKFSYYDIILDPGNIPPLYFI